MVNGWVRRALRVVLAAALLPAAPARAQQAPPAAGDQAARPRIQSLNSKQWTADCDEEHCTYKGEVELPLANGSKFFADQIELHFKTNRLLATGNVVFSNPEGRIAAERVDFDLAANTGTFHEAAGIMTLGATVDRAQFGNQDPDVYFWGETIEQLGTERFRITRGGFTTCVQPTPRWEVTTGSMELNLNDYAIARNTVLRVKGVPIFYLPLIYYPIQDDERATGFLLPTYGTSTLRGQAISNAFFWAMGRSQDATLFHDWFTRAGQGMGGEYRYVAAPESSGNFRVYRFNQRRAEFDSDDGTSVLPENSSFELTGAATHAFGRALRARARLDYASDIVSQQLYHQNVYRASNPIRVVEGSLSGVWGGFTANALYQRTEVFSDTERSTVYGSTPRLSGAIAPRRLFGLPVYGSLNAEYAFLPYQSLFEGEPTLDNGHTRVDVNPLVRVPLTGLTFLTVNTTASYRRTYYSRSFNDRGVAVPEPLTRTYGSVRSEVVGPVFTKIWDTPDSMRTERMKHAIEPTFAIDYVSGISNFSSIPRLTDNSDVIVGGSARFTYGVTNRLFSKGRTVDGVRGTAREFLTIGLQQTYYSEPEASKWDYTYYGNSGRTRLVDLSPVALTVRLSPATGFDANTRLEYDVSGIGLQTLSAGAVVGTTSVNANVNYSRIRYTRDSLSSHYLSTSNTMRLASGRVNGTYSLSWDLERSYVVSQGVMASYMAQCCGLQVEFQSFNYPEVTGIPIPSDRRFNFSIVLAGLGPVTNFFGAFGGQR